LGTGFAVVAGWAGRASARLLAVAGEAVFAAGLAAAGLAAAGLAAGASEAFAGSVAGFV
jgi:hypothetical protein